MAAHAHDIAVVLAVLHIVLVDLGVHGIGDERAHVGVGVELCDFLPQRVEIDGRQKLSRPAGNGLLPLEDDFLDVLREAPGRLAHHTLKVGDDRVREGEVFALLHDVLGCELVLNHEDGEVADHLGGGGHLDEVTQHVVDRFVHLLDLLKTGAKAERHHLRPQIRVLAAGNLIAVNFGCGGLEADVEGFITQPNVIPIVGQFLKAPHIKPRIPLIAVECRRHRVQRGLRGQTRHGADGPVDDVDSGFGRHEQRCHLIAGCVVSVQVDGQPHLLLKGGDELLCGIRLEKPRHVLDANGMCAAALKFTGQLHIVIEGVFIPLRVRDVAGVAHGGLKELILL
ncbi:hypothetical protein SDC9_84888 [bioreactor metagenome]|uniref:Uncharacterized protein n=1 Tax=bioreactor metagenome TaxID=1076179 RepID=A0A644ZC02_9ZZZZ